MQNCDEISYWCPVKSGYAIEECRETRKEPRRGHGTAKSDGWRDLYRQWRRLWPGCELQPGEWVHGWRAARADQYASIP